MKPIPFTGVCVQIYRGAIESAMSAEMHAANAAHLQGQGISPATPSYTTHAGRMAWLDAKLAALAAVGIKFVAWHGFTTEMTRAVFEELADLAAKHGIGSLAAFGLDATDPAGKGHRMGLVAQSPKCLGVLVDAEGAYDEHAQAAAVAMGVEFRKLAPGVWVVTQEWPLPGYHSRFPYKEFAAWTDASAPQFYTADWKSQYGQNAFEIMWPKFEAAWARLERDVLGPVLTLPRFPSVQTYGHPLDDAKTIIRSNKTLIGWGEPLPDAIFMQALREVQAEQATAPQ